MKTNDQSQSKPQIRLLTDRQILNEKFGGMSKATGHRRIFNDPLFPKPMPGFGKNLRLEREVDEYILTRLNSGEAA